MLAQMAPRLDPVRYHFLRVSPDNAPQILGAAIATFREEEGVSAIVAEPLAAELGGQGPAFARPAFARPAFARIVLQVRSDLEGVGLTAAVSGALANAGIACNVVAAFHHDHLFVPASRADDAMDVLEALTASVRGGQ